MPFTLRFFLAVAIAVAAATMLSPFAALITAALGFHFPFPRIFDRVVMVALALVFIRAAGWLGIMRRLRAALADPALNWRRILRGVVIALVPAIGLSALALGFGSPAPGAVHELIVSLPGYLAAAAAIALLEEGFFRALLLNGMLEDFSPQTALRISALIYALAHVVRSPARFYADNLDPSLGLQTLVLSFSQLAHPAAVAPALLGLYLLGLLLGDAMLTTGTVYLSIGIHGTLVLFAKSWRVFAPAPPALPSWLAGFGSPPLISGPAAWALIFVLIIFIRPLTRQRLGSRSDGG